MTPFAFIIGFGLIAWVIAPLFRRSGLVYEVHSQTTDLEDMKLRVYHNIKDLEFDYALGRLSEQDFQTIRSSFTQEATQVVAKLEQLQKHDLDALIAMDLKNHGETPASAIDTGALKFCTDCGHKNPAKAKFCSACGEKFEEI